MEQEIKSRFGNYKYEHFKVEFKGLIIECKLIDDEAVFPNSDQKEFVEQFKVTITNGTKSISYNFYNSIMERQISKFIKNNRIKGFQFQAMNVLKKYIHEIHSWGGYDDVKTSKQLIEKRIYYLLYGVLVSFNLDSQELYSFEDFCDNFGYDKDSRRAEKIYESCLELKQKLDSLHLSDEQRTYFDNEVGQESDQFSSDLKEIISCQNQ